MAFDFTGVASHNACQQPSKAQALVKSKNALAKALGVTWKTIQNWMKNPEWPFGEDGPWDPEAVHRWRRDHLAAQQDSATIVRMEKVARTRLTSLKADVLEGKYVTRERYEDALKTLADLFVQQLTDFETSLPTLVNDRTPPEVERVLSREFDHARSQLVTMAEQQKLLVSAESKNGKAKARPGRKPKNRAK